MGLYDYFVEVYGGDEFLKPNPNSYLNVCDDVSECVMIGDNYHKDFLGPKNIGWEQYYMILTIRFQKSVR